MGKNQGNHPFMIKVINMVCDLKIRRHDIQHNDSQHNDNQPKGRIADTQHKGISA
jgi:hypothetical protein